MGKVNIQILEQDLKPSFLDEENIDEEEVGPLYATEPVNVVYEENVEEEDVLEATEPVNVVYEENGKEEDVLDTTEPEPVLIKQDKTEDYKPNQPVKVGKMNHDVFYSKNNK